VMSTAAARDASSEYLGDTSEAAHSDSPSPTHRGNALASLAPGGVAQSSSGHPSLMEQTDARVALAVGRREPSPGDDDDATRRPCLEVTGVSFGAGSDVHDGAERRCLWCRSPLEQTQERWCSKKCRQTAWRSRKLAVAEDLGDTPKRLAYADPPYPGLSRKYYRDEPTYAGEVDHVRLLEQLATYDGWALSTSVKALRDILPLCPPEVRVCAWVKPIGASGRTRGIHNTWEPVIVKPARLRRPGLRDFLSAMPARGGGSLPGRKPIRFCAWLFALLGASHVDTLDDLFPGTGVVSRSFEQFRAKAQNIRGQEIGPIQLE
jgi:hypothetical protein